MAGPEAPGDRLGGDLGRGFDALGPVLPEPWRRLAEDAAADARHGDLPTWIDALRALEDALPSGTRGVLGPVPGLAGPEPQGTAAARLREALEALRPWRKGPVRFPGTVVDAEWRSDWKWARVAAALGSWTGARVLDVGCGNGYYALRALEAGARAVVGVDPSWLFVVQFLALTARPTAPPACVLPLRAEALPPASAFDIVLSLGVLGHRRDPAAHLRDLHRHLAPGGRLVLETLVVPRARGPVLRPQGSGAGRYARMRNVFALPDPPTLLAWLREAGFRAPHLADVSRTTVAEQRTTPWMPFESLREALDPADPFRTIEGHPAPRRALVVARADDLLP